MRLKQSAGSFGLVACVVLLACKLGGPAASGEAEPSLPTAPSTSQPSPSPRKAGAPRRLAVVVGIDRYMGSGSVEDHDGRRGGSGSERGRWRNLSGSVNDARALSEMLVARYGFSERDILLLTDQQATRKAILDAIDNHLGKPARRGDILLFYFAGHGSQAPSQYRAELDRLDETLVPADSILGAYDIRDKELRERFARILRRGARLTIIVDSCHSGSVARGPGLPTGEQPRGLEPAPHAMHTVAKGGPLPVPPEDLGALVLTASQDIDSAWEVDDEYGQPHGAFSLALLRAMRDADTTERAADTFKRIETRLQAIKPNQRPFLSSGSEALSRPLLRDGTVRAPQHAVVAVRETRADGTVILQGGWANGLTVGSELRVAGRGEESGPQLRVTVLRGIGYAEAQPMQVRSPKPPVALQPGTLLEIARWSPPPGTPMRIFMPHTGSGLAQVVDVAAELARRAPQAGLRWIHDPTVEPPAHLVRWRDGGWEILEPDGKVVSLGREANAARILAAIAPPRSSLFVQLPAPATLVDDLDLAGGKESNPLAVEVLPRPEGADYVLVGRLEDGRVEYSWVQPAGSARGQGESEFPERTPWRPLGVRPAGRAALREAALILQDDALRLTKILGWCRLESPSGGEFSYQLILRRLRDGALVEDTLRGGEEYELALRLRPTPLPSTAGRRYVYAFTIDSKGKSELLFPVAVENLLPPLPASANADIPLLRSGFRVVEPYGIDTYFLLTSDKPIDPSILEWDGIHRGVPRGGTAFEQLLLLTANGRRSSEHLAIPKDWSIERHRMRSIPAGTKVVGR